MYIHDNDNNCKRMWLASSIYFSTSSNSNFYIPAMIIIQSIQQDSESTEVQKNFMPQSLVSSNLLSENSQLMTCFIVAAPIFITAVKGVLLDLETVMQLRVLDLKGDWGLLPSVREQGETGEDATWLDSSVSCFLEVSLSKTKQQKMMLIP